jgi:hypothetical protein
MSDTASKKPRLESESDGQLQKLAQSARRQRELIRQKIEELNQSSVSPSKDVIPCSNSVIQLSNPAFDTKLPFPFVGGKVPRRFKVNRIDDERKWFYMGRERFAELRDKFEQVLDDEDCTDLTIYGTRGYGKSHLLAAFVCCLAATEQKVVYIPDCRYFLKDPVRHIILAMLFAWADNESKQQNIMELETPEDVYRFVVEQDHVIFVIDQLNALEKKENDDPPTVNKKAEVRTWLQSLVVAHKAILSSSANNHSILKEASKEPSESYSEIMYCYGGLTRVSLRSNNSFVIKRDASNYDLEGNGPLVGADAEGRTRSRREV